VNAREAAREALLAATEQLLNGDVPGPLTGLRLAEVAGVKRHRLTHDNPDIAQSFKDRVRQLNRHKPEVERLQDELAKRKARNTALFTENQKLKDRIEAYATRIDELVTERAQLLEAMEGASKVASIGAGRL
jgi:regulator of replication initiation timing